VSYSFPAAQAASANAVLVNNGSGDLSWSVTGIITLLNSAGTTVNLGQVVKITSTDILGLAVATDATLGDRHLGIVQELTIGSGSTGVVAVGLGTIVSGMTGLTPGALYYVSNSAAGDMVTTLTTFSEGDKVYAVGRALSSSDISFDPQFKFEY